jgi:hypothetical protein
LTENANGICNLVLSGISTNRSLIPVLPETHASPNTEVIPSLFKNHKLHHFHQQHIALKQFSQQSFYHISINMISPVKSSKVRNKRAKIRPICQVQLFRSDDLKFLC